MGPNNPWSPNWRPDPSGHRLAGIRTARRGAVLAGVAYVPLAAAAVATSQLPRDIALLALAVGMPGVALLGAGLAPAALGSRIDAVAVGVAFGIGSPVAAVTSIVIGAFVVGHFVPGNPDLAGPLLRAGVRAAVDIAPVVALVAAGWVVAVRWLDRATRQPPPTARTP
ncbi:MAG: hypothetical protein ACJ779_11205 [Chloroflexota bacterium]